MYPDDTSQYGSISVHIAVDLEGPHYLEDVANQAIRVLDNYFSGGDFGSTVVVTGTYSNASVQTEGGRKLREEITNRAKAKGE